MRGDDIADALFQMSELYDGRPGWKGNTDYRVVKRDAAKRTEYLQRAAEAGSADALAKIAALKLSAAADENAKEETP